MLSWYRPSCSLYVLDFKIWRRAGRVRVNFDQQVHNISNLKSRPLSGKLPRLFMYHHLHVPLFYFLSVLVNESSGLPYLSALGDFDDAELLELDESLAKEAPSSSVLPTSSQNTESFDNPYLRPAKRARKTIKPS